MSSYACGTALRTIIPLSALLMTSSVNSQDLIKPKLSIDKLYRAITLKNNKEFVVCVNKDSMYTPEQTAGLDYVAHVSCSDNNLGTIHSHPTHIDDYVCEPSDIDAKEFISGKDIFMGIACYDKQKNSVYVNFYGRR